MVKKYLRKNLDVPISVTVRKQDWKKFSETARKGGSTASAVLRMLISEYVSKASALSR